MSHDGLAVYSTVSFLSSTPFGKRSAIATVFSPLPVKVNGTVFITLSLLGNTGR